MRKPNDPARRAAVAALLAQAAEAMHKVGYLPLVLVAGNPAGGPPAVIPCGPMISPEMAFRLLRNVCEIEAEGKVTVETMDEFRLPETQPQPQPKPKREVH